MIRCDYCDKEMRQLGNFIFKCFTCNAIKNQIYNCDLIYLIPKNSNFIFDMKHINYPYNNMINDNGNLPQYIVTIGNKTAFIQKLYWNAKIFGETVGSGFDSKIFTPQNIDQKLKTILTFG
jgi:hypothetical protein